MSSSSTVSGVMSKRIIMSKDRVVAFLIKRSPKSEYYLRKGQSNLVSNNGENVLYDNVMLPIFGEIGDFGMLNKIDESETTKALESHFKKPIKEIMKSVGDEKADFLEGISVCYEHESIFKKMVEVNKQKSNISNTAISFPFVEHLGFKRVAEYPEENDFLEYAHPELKNIKVKASHYHLVVYKDFNDGQGFKEVKYLFGTEKLLQCFGLPLDSISGLYSTDLYVSLMESMEEFVNLIESFEDLDLASCLRKEIKRLEDLKLEESEVMDLMSEYIVKITEDHEKKSKALKRKDGSSVGKKEEERIRTFKAYVFEEQVMTSLLPSIAPYKLDKEAYKELLHFKSAMVSTNSIFMPTMSGYNDTVESYENDLLKVMNEMVK